MYTEQLDSIIAKVLAKRKHLAPGSEQTSSSSSTRPGSLDTPPVQSCPARAWVQICPVPRLCEEQGQASPEHHSPTQLSQMLQCEARGGRKILHV